MLHEKELPKKLWEEVANTIVFLLSMLPTRVLKRKTHLKDGLGTNQTYKI